MSPRRFSRACSARPDGTLSATLLILVSFAAVSAQWSGGQLVHEAACETGGAAGEIATSDPAREYASERGDTSDGVADIDGDRVDDCWVVTDDGGSGFARLAVRFGCVDEPQIVEAYGSFGEFLVATRLPPGLASRPGAVVGVIDRLFAGMSVVGEDGTRDAPDCSFRLLLDESAARAGAWRAVGPFMRVWHYTPCWTAGAPELPRSQVMVMQAPHRIPSVLTLESGERAPLYETGVEAPFALIAYGAHNHLAGGRQLAPAAKCGTWTVWTTAHGVVIEDTATRRSSWVYVSTGLVKLRWPSIQQVACAAGLVAMERSMQDGGRELVVVAPETGGVGTIELKGNATWKITAERLHVSGVGSLPLSTVGGMLELDRGEVEGVSGRVSP